MKEYCLGFIFFEDRVLLMRKERPEWMKGLWNGIGGKIELGETPRDAMFRETNEEIYYTEIPDWKPAGIIDSDTYVIHVYSAFNDIGPCSEKEDEPVHWWSLEDLPRTVPNLIYLIPMCKTRTKFTIHE